MEQNLENKNLKIEIIGRTNQGKSSLFNALLFKNIAITFDEENTTRDYVRFWGDTFVLTDNVGLNKPEVLDTRILESDVILYVVAYDEINEVDKFFFSQLHKNNKPFYLVFTKCDKREKELLSAKGTRAVEIFYTSIKHNYGLKELRDFLGIKIDNRRERTKAKDALQEITNKEEVNITSDAKQEEVRYKKKTIAIVGGVNSGKSSLLNLLAGYSRNKVSSVPATTRDAITEPIRDYYFVDTAGFNSMDKQLEKIALSRSLEILKNSDMAIIVVDASLSFSRWSKWLWLQCEKYNKGVILLFNKEDILLENQISKRYLLEQWSLKSYIPYLFFTTKNNKRVDELFQIIKKVLKSSRRKMSKMQLERFVSTIHLPNNNNRINLVQKDGQRFLLYCKKPVNSNYISYVENQLIKYFDLVGVKPIVTYAKMKY